MSAEPIEITGTLTYEDLLEIRRFQIRAAVRPSVVALMGIISGSLLMAIVFVSFRVKHAWPLDFVTAFFVYWPWGWLATRDYVGRGRWRRAAATMRERTVTFTADSLSLVGEDASVRIRWKVLKDVVRWKDGLLFCLRRGTVWFYLPARVLSDENRAKVIAMAVAGGVRVCDAQGRFSP